MITPHAFPPSGDARKVRAAPRLLDLPFEGATSRDGAHGRPPSTDLNPLGQVPVPVAGDTVPRGGRAILVHPAAAHRPGGWDGHGPAERGHIARWLSLAADGIAHGPNRLRLAASSGASVARPAAEASTARVLDPVERRLAGGERLVGDRLATADLARAPYLALAHRGGVALSTSPRVCAWTARIAPRPRPPAMDGWGAPSTAPAEDARP